MPQALSDAGDIRPDEIRHHEDRNRLLRALGADDSVNPTLSEGASPLAPGTAFLLCSDGFWDYVDEPRMTHALARSSSAKEWLHLMEQDLLHLELVDQDNYSAIAVLCLLAFAPGDAESSHLVRLDFSWRTIALMSALLIAAVWLAIRALEVL